MTAGPAVNNQNTIKTEGKMNVEKVEKFSNLSTLLSSNKLEEKEQGVKLFDELIEVQNLPYLLSNYEGLLNHVYDKKSGDLRKLATDANAKFIKMIPAIAAVSVIPLVLKTFSETTKWQLKVVLLESLCLLSDSAPEQISQKMVEIMPIVSGAMASTKKQVKTKAKATLIACCNSIDNKDLEPFIEPLVETIDDPEQVTETVSTLASTTFVQAIDAAALSLTMPVVIKGLKEKATATKRRAAVIAENMFKLVRDPRELQTFKPLLLPLLERNKEEVADIECRTRTTQAYDQLILFGTIQESDIAKAELIPVSQIEKIVTKIVNKVEDKKCFDLFVDVMSKNLDYLQDIDHDEISMLFQMLIKSGHDQATETLLKEFNNALDSASNAKIYTDDNAKDKETLCDTDFSLAYGTKILLNQAKLYLKRGQRYGIVAQKSAGKTTLLNAIVNGQIDGFPPPSELKTVLIAHDISPEQAKMNVVEFTLDTTKADGVTRDQVEAKLRDIGFTDEMVEMPITSLSGGWKMKLGLARAILRKADILLADEPTNHLDVLNVQWVVDYLTGEECANVTSLIVSHDTAFLDKVCTNIINFNRLKLDYYTGNLSAFVEKVPEAKSLFELGNTDIVFKFPTPMLLDGVKAKGKTILQMTDVHFTYPGATKPQLIGVTVKASMGSRVACVGANGAGKSTLIKVLTGELVPTKGTVVKHPNCKFAYVAQHAFHHIEQHLKKTPNEYIQWRYQHGEDKEALVKVTSQITEEEKKQMEKPFEVKFEDEDGNVKKEKRVIEKIVARRKNGKNLEYECKFVNRTQGQNLWYLRDTLVDMGFEKLLKEVDRRKAAQEGAYQRVLTKRNVEQHLADVGLDAELATHTRIDQLSSGQKVKVVLGACTWMLPHLIILDEPTNYLDRESLGALANAINDFEGGVLLISHNKEFCEKTTRETWVVANNRCDIKGDAEWEKYAAEQLELQAAADQTDAAGNKVVQKKSPDSVKPREKKKMIKTLKQKIKDEDEMTDFELACCDAWGLWL